MTRPIIMIPARLGSTRLPNKPLADICGEPMIVHVWRRALEADIGEVLVATDSPDVAAVVRDVGGRAVLSQAPHESGSDRIFEALQRADPDRRHDVVINVQGDLPTISPRVIGASVKPLQDDACDIATLTVEISKDEERTNPNVVKIVGTRIRPDELRAFYFTRATAPYGPGPLWHHVGLYAYRRTALERFVSLPPSDLEKREKLEQLRAIEDGMRIHALVVRDIPLGVDTADDLEEARRILGRSAAA